MSEALRAATQGSGGLWARLQEAPNILDALQRNLTELCVFSQLWQNSFHSSGPSEPAAESLFNCQHDITKRLVHALARGLSEAISRPGGLAALPLEALTCLRLLLEDLAVKNRPQPTADTENIFRKQVEQGEKQDCGQFTFDVTDHI